jgi:hypothetical protein
MYNKKNKKYSTNKNNKNNINKENMKIDDDDEDIKILKKELEEEAKYRPPESWTKNLKPLISTRIISSRVITKEEYNAHYNIRKYV